MGSFEPLLGGGSRSPGGSRRVSVWRIPQGGGSWAGELTILSVILPDPASRLMFGMYSFPHVRRHYFALFFRFEIVYISLQVGRPVRCAVMTR